MGLSGRPNKLSSRVWEGDTPSTEESGVSLNRPWLKPKREMPGSPDESQKEC